MKYKEKRGLAIRAKRLELMIVCSLCFCFFLAGLFGSMIVSQNGSMVTSMEEGVYDEGDPMSHGNTGEGFISSIPFQVLSWKPRAVYFPNFATPEQCRIVVHEAKNKLRPSGLALRVGETTETTKGIRTSSGTFLSASSDKTGVLELIERKIARATLLPRSHGEAFNVLRYEIGQGYSSHYDSFDPAEYGPQRSQRVASFLLYLTDVEEGGETIFPYENGSNMDIGYDYKGCIGLKVKPKMGDGLLFFSCSPNGTIDKTSLHGSCPVIKGEKWVATKWIRDNGPA